MAQLQDTILSGSLKLPTVENTASAGNVWFDEVAQKAKYSYYDGVEIQQSNLGER